MLPLFDICWPPQHNIELLHRAAKVVEANVGRTSQTALLVSCAQGLLSVDHLELANDLEHLCLHQHAGHLVHPLIASLQPDRAPQVFDQFGVNLRHVLVKRLKKVFARDHVSVQGRVWRNLFYTLFLVKVLARFFVREWWNCNRLHKAP